jgi:hypothetical protein
MVDNLAAIMAACAAPEQGYLRTTANAVGPAIHHPYSAGSGCPTSGSVSARHRW